MAQWLGSVSRPLKRVVYRVEDEHLAEEVDSLVGGLRRQRVEGGQRRGFGRSPHHVLARRLAGTGHVLHVRRSQQVRYQLQLTTTASQRLGQIRLKTTSWMEMVDNEQRPGQTERAQRHEMNGNVERIEIATIIVAWGRRV